MYLQKVCGYKHPKSKFTLTEIYSYNKEISKYDIFILSYYFFDNPKRFDPYTFFSNEN